MFYVHCCLEPMSFGDSLSHCTPKKCITAVLLPQSICSEREKNASSQDADVILAWYPGTYLVVALSPWPGCRLRLHCACSCAVFMPPYIFIFLGGLTQSTPRMSSACWMWGFSVFLIFLSFFSLSETLITVHYARDKILPFYGFSATFVILMLHNC